jgi:hypothetical protein
MPGGLAYALLAPIAVAAALVVVILTTWGLTWWVHRYDLFANYPFAIEAEFASGGSTYRVARELGDVGVVTRVACDGRLLSEVEDRTWQSPPGGVLLRSDGIGCESPLTLGLVAPRDFVPAPPPPLNSGRPWTRAEFFEPHALRDGVWTTVKAAPESFSAPHKITNSFGERKVIAELSAGKLRRLVVMCEGRTEVDEQPDLPIIKLEAGFDLDQYGGCKDFDLWVSTPTGYTPLKYRSGRRSDRPTLQVLRDRRSDTWLAREFRKRGW